MLRQTIALSAALILLSVAGSMSHEAGAAAGSAASDAAPTLAETPRFRLFGTSTSLGIVEIDTRNGAILKKMNAPVAQGVADGLAFSGSRLFYLSGSHDPDRLHVLDPDSGALERSIDLPPSSFRNGLAYLDGLVYVLDWSALTQEIHAVDPQDGRVVRRLDIDGANPGAPGISGGLAAITGPDALLVTTVGTNEILELDPMKGRITNRIEHGLSGAGGLAVVNGRIFLGINTGRDLRIYSRTGFLEGMITVMGSIGFQSLGGDDAGASRYTAFVPFCAQHRP